MNRLQNSKSFYGFYEKIDEETFLTSVYEIERRLKGIWWLKNPKGWWKCNGQQILSSYKRKKGTWKGLKY